ncbi:UNVERIFIED_CONTAM: H-SHIPPO 1, putative [Hammondia hammondi]|eukprot:XP_008884337.1 H-SHIPPO 1, putative [Hammondia hammondi]
MERVADHYLTTLSNVPSAPKWSFGGRPRPVSASATPGPGTYESGGRTSTTAPSYGFGSEVRGRSRAQPFPGPGAYDPSKQSARTAPQWSMAGRRAATKVDSSPGPGAYDVKHNSGSPSYGLGTGQRKTFSAPNTPGPGAYSPRFLGDSSPQWGMGTQNRSRAGGGLKVDVPGPGTYTLPSRLQESPQYSMAGRGEQKRKDNSPGPGSYNPHYPERDAGKFSFGVKPAASRPGGSTPGPGAYNMTGDIASPKSPQWSFGSQVRGRNYVTSSPGPGQYNPENSPRKRPPAWSLGGGGERGFYCKRDGPAPGTYNIPSRLGEGAK